jgi:hypothetical protein
MRFIKNERRHGAFLAIIVGAVLLTTAGAAYADPPKDSAAPCFFITQWRGWKSPSPNVIYLGVNMHDVYRVDLSAGSRLLQTPNVHLVSRTRGPDTVCSAIDLQLEVSDDIGGGGRFGTGIGGDLGGGMREPLIASKLTKLTPEEIAVIPKQYRPN